MNKILYIILIVFLGLTTASGIWNFIIGFKMGPEIYKLDSYVQWFLVGNITAFIGSILLLKYYYDRNYRLAFFTGVIVVITNLGYTTVLYIALTSGELRSYYMPAVLLNLCAIIVYAVVLIFSNTRKRFWLKLVGFCGLVIGLVLVSALIGGMYPKNAWIINIFGKIAQWSPIAWYLVDVMFIMNFVGEFRTLKTENANVPRQRFLVSILGVLAIAAVVFTITTGKLLVNESDSQYDWRKDTAVQAQRLVWLAGGARTFVDSEGDSLHYLLIKPQNYDKQKKYPLVVCLPYGGYEAGAAELLSTDGRRSTYPAFIFVPYCPEGEGWGGIPGCASLDLLVYETISALTEPGIDVKRRYVTGVSRGGYGTWQFICSRPDMFAAAMPVCGGGDPELASKIVNMPIWAFHGANDKNVPVSGSRDIISAIKKAGGHPRYTEYPDEAHNIWDKVSDTPGLWNWLFAQKRE
ncbi:MAG: peptidase-like protein [Mucilaginibacter sp.]|nr:peptidase-like protein [Mucilaginibacter sp.]